MLIKATRTRIRWCIVGVFLVLLLQAVLINLAVLVAIRSTGTTELPGMTRPALPSKKGVYTDVLISSYMRSGSSFLGRVLGVRRDAFYVYEPLFSMARYEYLDGDHELCGVFNSNCRKSTGLPVALKVLRQIYNCSFYMKPAVNVFKENINMKLSGPKWKAYQSCPDRHSSNSTCMRQMADKVCRSSKHKVTKVLRLSVSSIEPLLKSNRNLKVVYLVRDPRAIINSHMRTGWSHIRRGAVNSIAGGAEAICDRIVDDVSAAVALRSTYPDRFIIVQYEDFANPLTTVKSLFKFLNMNFTEEAMKFIVSPKKTKGEQPTEDKKETHSDLKEIQGILDKLKPEDAKAFLQTVIESKVNSEKNPTEGGMADDSHMLAESEADARNQVVEDQHEENFYNDDIPDDVNTDYDINPGSKNNLFRRSLKSVKTKTGAKSGSSKDGNHPFAYRESLSWLHTQVIDQRCEAVYKLLGYRKYTSEADLWDLSVPAVTYPLPFSIG